MQKETSAFVPHRWLRNGHTMTMVSAFVPRKFRLPAPEQRLFRVDPYSQLLALCHWQEGKRRDVPVIAIVHGLEGSCDSNYVVGIAEKAWERGFHVVRLNQRNCGGSEKLTPTLYNSGMSGDYACVLVELANEDGRGIWRGLSAGSAGSLRGLSVDRFVGLCGCSGSAGELFVPTALCEGFDHPIHAQGADVSGPLLDEWS